ELRAYDWPAPRHHSARRRAPHHLAHGTTSPWPYEQDAREEPIWCTLKLERYLRFRTSTVATDRLRVALRRLRDCAPPASCRNELSIESHHLHRNGRPREITFHPQTSAFAHLTQRHVRNTADCLRQARRIIPDPQPTAHNLHSRPWRACADDDGHSTGERFGHDHAEVFGVRRKNQHIRACEQARLGVAGRLSDE